MDILILAIIVCIIAALAIWLVRETIDDPGLSKILKVAIVVVAVLIIIQRSGLLG